MKKFIFIFVIPFIMILATGCNARRNTIHFEPEENGEVSTTNELGLEDSEMKKEETVKGEVKNTENSAVKKADSKLGITAPEGGDLETNLNYHVVRGTASPQTHAIKVNDYVLTKYLPGQTGWSYIASTALNTLKEGENKYTVTALDKEGKTLETSEFSISYEEPKVKQLPFVGVNEWAILIVSLLLSGVYFGTRKIIKVKN